MPGRPGGDQGFRIPAGTAARARDVSRPDVETGGTQLASRAGSTSEPPERSGDRPMDGAADGAESAAGDPA
jgi:hypothetical protein